MWYKMQKETQNKNTQEQLQQAKESEWLPNQWQKVQITNNFDCFIVSNFLFKNSILTFWSMLIYAWLTV